MQDYLLTTIINMVKTTSNDMELGKKVRTLLAAVIAEQTPSSGNKQLLKD